MAIFKPKFMDKKIFGFQPNCNQLISDFTFTDESLIELGLDKITNQGAWLLDASDRKYISKVQFPKRALLFVALGGALYYDLITIFPGA